MITDRLVYFLEKRELITSCPSGFRKGRGTMDPVLCLEDKIRKAQVSKKTVVAVFFDVEKAYDMMWKEGLMIKLDKMGIGGRAFNWVKDFLYGRSIRVRVGKEISGYLIENGTPQGSVISPLLFSITINDVFSDVGPGVGRSLFADDGTMWKRGRNIKYTVRKVQEAIELVERRSLRWGFGFSREKTQVVFFTRKKVDEEINLKLYGHVLERVESFKFLGMVFDASSTWAGHIEKVLVKCKKVLNVMRCLVGVDWGTDRKAMKRIYGALIKSIIDYGCIAYRDAARTTLAKLDVVQTQALRLCTGAFLHIIHSCNASRNG